MKRLLLFIALASVAHAAGSVQQNMQSIGGNVFAFSFNWIGDSANGSVPATIAQGSLQLQGYRVISMETTPGSPAPTNGYSITLIDNAGVDIMANAAASLSNTSGQSFAGSPTAPPLYGSFAFTVTGNSVASAKGSAIVYLAPLSQVLGLSPTAPNFPSQGANLVFASPNGASGSPGFRSIATPDLTTIAQGVGDTKVELAGTNSGTAGAALCNDANGGATTSGCSPLFPSGTQTQYLQVKPNTGNNTTFQFNTLPTNASDYNFPAYSCNASLVCAQGGPTGGAISPGATTITMNPCPLGVNGGDANHNLYISGGSGTAEAVLITSGTCTSGASTGTVVFTAVNSHSGAFTVTSNSAGIQEAWNVNLSISLMAGSYNIFGTITPPANATINCQGTQADQASNTVLSEQFLNVPLFNVINDKFRITGCNLSQAGVATTGSDGIKFGSANARFSDVIDVNIFFFFHGIESTTLVGGSLNLINVLVASSVDFGILASQGWQGTWNTVVIEKSGNDGLHMDCNPSGCQGGWISGLQTFNNKGWGVWLHNVPTVIGGNGNSLNNDLNGELFVSGSLQPPQISNLVTQSAGNSTSFGINTSAPGIRLDYDTVPTLLTNVTVSNSEGVGINITSTAQPNGPPQLNNVWVFNSGLGAVAGNTYALLASNEVMVMNSLFLGTVELTGANLATFMGNHIVANTAALPALQITGNSGSVVFDQNTIQNVAAASTAFQCDSGSTLLPGVSNILSATTTQVNNCTPSIAGFPNLAFGQNGFHLNTVSAANDVAGTCTFAATTCTVTFSTAYLSAPACTASDQTAAAPLKVATAAGNMVITGGTGAGATDVISYHCMGKPN